MANATIRPAEAEHFGKLAADWWNPKGSSAMLHKLNPVRLGFLREAIENADLKRLRRSCYSLSNQHIKAGDF